MQIAASVGKLRNQPSCRWFRNWDIALTLEPFCIVRETATDADAFERIVVATTNLEDSLDAALFRRFDDVFLIPLSGSDEIEQLLRTRLSAVAVSNDVDWRAIVKQLERTSATMVVKAAEDAAKATVLRGKKSRPVRLKLGCLAESQSKFRFGEPFSRLIVQDYTG